MPIPKPRKGETAQAFVSRCAGDATMNTDYPDSKQRVAVCYSAYRDAHPHAAPPPKAASPAACYPQPDESRGDFMSRCTSGGDSEEACVMAWEADKALPASVERDVQMKWMPTVLEVKGLNEGERTIIGTASTADIDLVGDVVVPGGCKYKLPLPLLLGHRHDQVVGSVTYAMPNEKGIPFQARIAKIDDPGRLKDRCDESWQMVRSGLCRGVSIGFSSIPEQTERLKSGGLKFNQWLWHELSLVVVPANQNATIDVIRSLDHQALEECKPARATPKLESPKRPQPAPAVSLAAVEQRGVLAWINNPANVREWRNVLEERKGARAKDDLALERQAAANIRLRQPLGDITQEQIRFEAWEIRRYW